MNSRILLVLVIATGIVVPGVANYYLTEANLHTLGSMVWVGGYGAMIVVVWYGWIRPLDIGGPADGTEP